ncbi:MAG: HAD family phosphatase [Clostridiales bacterium]|nr:HAD family phosphatase [Clostridiales bacterium]MDO4351047.1 HAD family phosphatase [Eubacteriales bacterium]MDY4007601.1 HAD family phosphatase [Candidatus Limiplasma sp.]
MIQAVLFDMDGVLLDTERLGREIMIRACAQRGYAFSPELYISILGCTQELSRRILADTFGPAFPYEEIMRQFHQELLQIALADGLPVKPGLLACMEGLKARGVRRALATSTARPIVEKYMARLPLMQNCFDAMVCGAEGGRSKPEPDIYLEAARRLGLAPGDCLGVEDSLNGLRSLTAAGCVSVMIPDLLPYNESLAGVVKHRLSDLGQVCALIDRINAGARARA